jgi:hypothetical protein
MSRKVIIKALLPHRDTISTMTVSPRLLRAELYISGLYECMPQVSKSGKKPAFCSVMSGSYAGEPAARSCFGDFRSRNGAAGAYVRLTAA